MSELRIDFYILSAAGADRRARIACQLAEKAYQHGYSVYIFTSGAAQAATLDDLLWTFRQDSFVPHERYPLRGAHTSPVLIGNASPLAVTANALINLTDTVPAGIEKFERIMEVVDADASVLSASRQRFKHYREQGCDPQVHKL